MANSAEKIRIMLLGIALALPAWSARADTWPKVYNAPSAKWKQVSLAEGTLYRSRSYAILTGKPMSVGRVDEMIKVAESVRGVLQRFPLQLLSSEAGGNGTNGRDVVRIYPTTKEYAGAGGPSGTAGFFDGRSGEVIVNHQFLIEPKGFRSNLEPRQRYRLLVHELVHQVMGERTAVLPLWFCEGLAEYLSAMQFAPGRYRFDSSTSTRNIINHFRAVWLHDGRKAITIPTIESLTDLTFRTWAADNQRNRENGYAKYAGALLLTHYQLELAARDLGGLQEFLANAEIKFEAVKGRPRRFRRIAPDDSVLWKERPPKKVQEQLAAYWKDKGLFLRFKPLRPLDRPKPSPAAEGSKQK